MLPEARPLERQGFVRALGRIGLAAQVRDGLATLHGTEAVDPSFANLFTGFDEVWVIDQPAPLAASSGIEAKF